MIGLLVAIFMLGAFLALGGLFLFVRGLVDVIGGDTDFMSIGALVVGAIMVLSNTITVKVAR